MGQIKMSIFITKINYVTVNLSLQLQWKLQLSLPLLMDNDKEMKNGKATSRFWIKCTTPRFSMNWYLGS